MRIKFSVLVVLFKTSLRNSTTLESLLKIKQFDTELYIWDNSPTRVLTNLELDYIKSHLPSYYFHTPTNISLSSIYNRVSLFCSGRDFLVIFDQDSEFSSEFFSRAAQAICENRDIDLYIPYVKIEGKIYSPGRHNYIKGKYWKELILGRTESKNTVAIASGMVIRVDFLIGNYPLFDERLRFYGVDTDFLLEYSRYNQAVFVLNYNLKHGLSQNDNENISMKLFRFREMMRSALVTARKKSSFHFWITRFYYLYASWKMVLRHKTLRFIREN